MNLQEALMSIIPDPERVSSSPSVREQHGRDLSYHHPHLPDVVVFATSTREVSEVLKFANTHRVPVVPFAVASSLEGHIIPVHGGISLDLNRMNQIVEVCPNDFLVRVQPGVTREQLNATLKTYGLFFPVDPGANASLGGMAATNASGTTAVRYGAMRTQVLGLEVVLADGRVVRTGGMTMKTSAGYNFTHLFIGSEGTLGVITELTLRVYGIPEQTVAARAVFANLDAACQAAYGIIGAGISVGRVELVDERTVAAVNRFKQTAYEETPTLFLEFSGSRAAVQAEVQLAQEICEEEGCRAFVFETEGDARARLWEARHAAALAIMQTAPGKRHKATDVCVPLSKMPEAIRFAQQTIDRHGIYGAILGHVGDGNYHVSFMVDPDDEREVAVAEQVNDEIVEYALAVGGTCTGEHGVGLGKIKHLAREHADLLPLMKAMKAVLDPNGILNPGKVFI
ncbi:FAD-binding oxidoreductase [Alicyclobacillus shizuokensis]|uniref:FAD-binding oxidoreductase n=1 Tax=Alicyclobacillus shizuokensis TaxID=392014 RepID=UPI000832B803|nr:FAD-linked oxidase C-terminal domain-containing protein [Alicyclobacillus shizuokensis]MCL6625780.1 FAD-binding protein [Alicyclobacillus shizuokensis]